jgi:hypothetical protein
MRMGEARDRPHLPLEPLPGFRALRPVRGESLQRDRAIEPGIAGAVHLALYACRYGSCRSSLLGESDRPRMDYSLLEGRERTPAAASGRGLGSRRLRKGISTSRSSASHSSGASVHSLPGTKWRTEQEFFFGSSFAVCAGPFSTRVEIATGVNATAARRAGCLPAQRSAEPTTDGISRPRKAEGVMPNDKRGIESGSGVRSGK